MKNPKYLIGFMVAILVIVWVSLKSVDFDAGLKKNRIEGDTGGLNVKRNTFAIAHKAAPKFMAPRWGSFKSEPQPVATVVAKPKDKNQDLLKTLAKKAADKLKEANKKRKKALALRRRPGIHLINTGNSRVDRSLRKFDDGFGNENPVAMPVGYIALPVVEAVAADAARQQQSRSLEEWQALLLERANPQASGELIAAYQSNGLGQRSWAFLLAQQMLESQNPDVEAEGIKVLNAIPSEQSFAILAAQTGQHSDKVNKDIQKSIAVYPANIQLLTVLERSVLSGDPLIQIQAADAIAQSAQAHLAPQAPPAAGNDAGARPPAAAAETVVTPAMQARYMTTLNVLNTADQKTKNPEAKSHIEQAISTLNTLIQTPA
jgi:hypothetical protein